MRPNYTLQKLRAGGRAIGYWLGSHNPWISRLIAHQGLLDWVMIDGEHTPVDTSVLALCCGFLADGSQGRVAPMARVAAGTVDQIKRVLDSGAQGVLVPLVNTAEHAAEIVQHAKYPPAGARGNGGMLAHLAFGADRLEYSSEANDHIMVSVQIETREAVANIDAICQVKGIDCAFVGPNDLHIAHGLPPSYWTNTGPFHDAASRVLAAAQRHGVIPGILCANAEQARDRLAEGWRFVGLGSDVSLVMTGIQDAVATVKTALNAST
jgi:4-hydroxy-2-oxoheptanedioate aldolase